PLAGGRDPASLFATRGAAQQVLHPTARRSLLLALLDRSAEPAAQRRVGKRSRRPGGRRGRRRRQRRAIAARRRLAVRGVERPARLGDDVGQFLQRVDLLADGAAHGGCRLLGLFGQLDDALLDLGAGLLQLAADAADRAADLFRRFGEALGGTVDHLGDGRADLLGGRAGAGLRLFQRTADEILEGL